DVGIAADVGEFRDYLANLRDIVKKATEGGKKGDDLVNAALPAVKEKYGKWDFFEYFAKSNILDMAAELRGDKKIPTPPGQPINGTFRRFTSNTRR
ncbi:MAG: hypothetical protein ACRD36_13275, partial [Candidatus Acidiferrum sp.]